MAYNIPTLQELKDAHQARLEAALGQDAPSNDKAFVPVLAATEAAEDIGHYKYAADRAKQNLALTATGDDLDRIGEDNDTPRKNAEAWIGTATLPAETGTVIPTTIDFIADATGLRYRATEEAIAAANVATLTLQCVESGADGGLEISDTLEIAAQISGAETTATVTAVTQEGIDEESDADYRPRVLFAQRAITGGCNATDHKIWSEAVTGVKRAFPYAGRPADEGDSYPGDRTVYVEAVSTIDADGIAPSWLLDDVRDAINTDPDTGEARSALGLTDDTLFVDSITRTTFHVTINGFSVDSDKESACKAAISTALASYFAGLSPFVDGVDVAIERNDNITSMSTGQSIQDVMSSYGAYATSIGVGTSVGVFFSIFTLGQGQLAKLGTIVYA